MNINKVEIKELEEKGFIKIPLIVAVLTEAEEQGLKWIFQCDGWNYFPEDEANERTGDYDNWVYTNDVEASLKQYNATDMMHIVFDKGGWIMWVTCNGDGVDALADWTTHKHIDTWLRPIMDKYNI
jgi:hypothetical protein|tara:strand:+ start:54 stop:431 length:378 start_codon:yes stop_codon:yes gene_type:complete